MDLINNFLGVVNFIGLAAFGAVIMRVLLYAGDALKAYAAFTKRKQP